MPCRSREGQGRVFGKVQINARTLESATRYTREAIDLSSCCPLALALYHFNLQTRPDGSMGHENNHRRMENAGEEKCRALS